MTNILEEGIPELRRRVGEEVDLFGASLRLIPEVNQFPGKVGAVGLGLWVTGVTDLADLHLGNGNQDLVSNNLHFRLVRYLGSAALEIGIN